MPNDYLNPFGVNNISSSTSTSSVGSVGLADNSNASIMANNSSSTMNYALSPSDLKEDDIELIKKELERKIQEQKEDLENAKNTRGWVTSALNGVKGWFGGGDKKVENNISNYEALLSGLDSDISNIDEVYKTIMGSDLDSASLQSLKGSETLASSIDSQTQEAIVAELENQLAALESNFEATKSSNGWISGTWNAFKNWTGIGASSNKTSAEIDDLKEQIAKLKNGEANLATTFKNITGADLNTENLTSLLSGEVGIGLDSISNAGQKVNAYSEGQKMCSDVVGDMVSGITSVGVVAFGTAIGICAAPFTAGASLGLVAAGFGIAAGAGAIVKTAIKASDCMGNEKKYSLKDAGYDILTGSINGAAAPLTNALGGAIGTGIMKACGQEALETTVKSGALLAAKSAGKEILEEGVEQVSKKVISSGLTKAASFTANSIVDGGLSGLIDGSSRALAEGRYEDIFSDGIDGLKGGLIAAPIMGAGFNLAGKAGSKLGQTALGQAAGKALKEGTQVLGGAIDNVLPQGVKRVVQEGSEKLNKKFIQTSLKNCLTISDDGIYSVKTNGYSVQLIEDELSEEILEAISRGDNSLVFNYANEILAQELSKNITDAASANTGEALELTSGIQNPVSENPTRSYVVDIENETVRTQEARIANYDETITELGHPIRRDNKGLELRSQAYGSADEIKFNDIQNFEVLKHSFEKKLQADGKLGKYHISSILQTVNEKNLNSKIKIYDLLNQDGSFENVDVFKILEYTTEKNLPLAELLCANQTIPKNKFSNILRSTTIENISLAQMLCLDGKFSSDEIVEILDNTDKENILLAELLCKNEKIHSSNISEILYYTTEENILLAQMLCLDEKFPKGQVSLVLDGTNIRNIDVRIKMYDLLRQDETFPSDKIWSVLDNTSKKNIDSKIKMYDLLRQDEVFPKEELPNVLQYTNETNILFAQTLCTDKNFPKNKISKILSKTNKKNIDSKIKMYDLLRQDETFSKEELPNVLQYTNEENISLAQTLCINKNFPKSNISDILDTTTKENIPLAEILCADENFPKDKVALVLEDTNEINIDSKINIYNLLKQDNSFPISKMHNALQNEHVLIEIKKSNNEELFVRAKNMIIEDFDGYQIKGIAENELYYKRAMELTAKPNMDREDIIYLVQVLNTEEYLNVLELSEYLNSEQIQKYRNVRKLTDILNSAEYSKNKDTILKINNDKTLSNEAKNILSDRLLGVYDNDYSKLTLREKINQINVLKKAQSCDIFTDEERNFLNIDNEIIELQESIKKVIATTSTSKEATQKMMSGFFANNNPQLDNLLSTTDFSQFGKSGLPLEYSRQAFISDLSETIKNLPEAEQADILKKLGITLTNNKDVVGYDGIIDLSKLSSNGIEGDVLSLATKFIKENSISTGDDELDDALNSLIKGMPEFINVIGKQQHGTQDFSVDIHMLTVLKEAMSNPNYQNLSNQDKFCLKFATILHDIAKSEGVVDDGHAELCALYARDILNKDTTSLPVEMKDRIYELVKNHHWLADYNKGNINKDKVAALYRRTGDLEIAQIMAEADLKGVKADGSFYESHRNALGDDMQIPIQNALISINSQGQMFLTNKIIDSSKVPTVIHNGTEYQVINFTQLAKSTDLQQYGFEPGTTVDNLRLMIHTIKENNIKGLENVYILNDPSYQGFLCTSYVSIDNHSTYRNNKFGVSVETEQANIANAASANQASGCGKDFIKFSNIITGVDETSQYRNLIPSSIKKALSLTDDEYSNLFAQVQKYKYVSQLDNIQEIKIGEKTFTGTQVKTAILEADDLMMTPTKSHNEANLYSPKVNAVVAKVDSLDEVPQELLDFAQAHNLPIYLLGE